MVFQPLIELNIEKGGKKRTQGSLSADVSSVNADDTWKKFKETNHKIQGNLNI